MDGFTHPTAERIAARHVQPCLDEEREPVAVVDGDTGTLLLAEDVHCDLSQLLAAEFAVCLERKLRRDPEHFVHPPQQPRRFGDVAVNLLDQLVQPRRLLAERLESAGDDLAFLLDRLLNMLGEVRDGHRVTLRLEADEVACSTTAPVPPLASSPRSPA
jgi:hypothetical protein